MDVTAQKHSIGPSTWGLCVSTRGQLGRLYPTILPIKFGTFDSKSKNLKPNIFSFCDLLG